MNLSKRSISINISLTVALLLTSCNFSSVQDEGEDWQSLYKQAKVFEFAGEDGKATRRFKQTLNLIPADDKKTFYETDINVRITKILVNKGLIEKAKPLVAKISSYKGNDKVSLKEQSELLVLFDDLSDLYLQKAIKSDKNYLYCLNTSLKFIHLSESRVKRRSIKIYSLLASYYIDQKEFEKGMRFFDTALDTLDEDKSNINDDIEALLYVYISLKNFNLEKQADQVMRRLIRIYKGNVPFQKIPYYMYGKLGIAYGELQQYDKAREAYLKAIKLAEENPEMDPTTLSAMHLELALTLEKLKLYRKSDQAFKQAIKIQRKKTGRSNSRLIAKRLDAYSKYLQRRKEFEQARAIEKEAIKQKSTYFKTLGRKH